MEIKCNLDSFDTCFTEKIEIENETEYTLPEYMPSIQRVVKSEAKLKITDSRFDNGILTVSGDIVYSVLYISENSGLLKNVIFTDTYEATSHAHIREETEYENDCVEVFFKTVPGAYSVRQSGNRNILARSRFSVLAEAYNVCSDSCCEDEKQLDCEVEFLRKNITASSMKKSEVIRTEIAEEISIADDMPEISDIVMTDAHCCVKNVSNTEGSADIVCEVTFDFLYEAHTDNSTDYISFQKTIPLRTEVQLENTDSEWSVFADVNIVSAVADVNTNSYGEQRIIDVEVCCEVYAVAFSNHDCVVYADMYSTECCVEPEVKNIRNYRFLGEYKSLIDCDEHLRIDLRGMVDIVASSLKLCFSNPETFEGSAYISAKGTLHLLGMKENGDIESQSVSVNIKLPTDNIPEHLIDKKTKWFNFTSLCRHECVLVSGEAVLKLWVNQNLAALSEENNQVICGYEKCDDASEKTCGFTMYYPNAGEKIWNVAKTHRVSCEKLKVENDITGDTFDGNKPIILH